MTASQSRTSAAVEHFKNSRAQVLQPILKRATIGAGLSIPILIEGATGTGKEVLANTIHEMSKRPGKMIAVNCAAIPADLAEAEFFGHQKGAFTGAVTVREGYFRAANKGTLFLDEVGELALPMQAKLLRVLQEKKVKPVGSDEEHAIDVRIITATNCDLDAMVEEGKFREDLLFRLNVLSLHMPSLADRPEDIPELTRHFLSLHEKNHGFPSITIDENAVVKLQQFGWPGNIRQLSNVIASSAINAIAEGRYEILSSDIELEKAVKKPVKSIAPKTENGSSDVKMSSGPYVVNKSIITDAELRMLALESPSARIIFKAACDSMSKVELRAYSSIILRHASEKISPEKLADMEGLSEGIIRDALIKGRIAVSTKLREGGYDDLVDGPVLRKRTYQSPDQDGRLYSYFNETIIQSLSPEDAQKVKAASLLLNRRDYHQVCWFMTTPSHIRRKAFAATPELASTNYGGVKKAVETFQELNARLMKNDERYADACPV